MGLIAFLSRAAAAGLVGTFLFPIAALAQDAADPAAFARGEALYAANCALCHKDTGAGRNPGFPALRGNDGLSDVHLVASKIHAGLGDMPAFPTLDAAEITDIATYVRNAWGNAFGGVTQDEVEEVMAGFDPSGEMRTIWDGIYTEPQARHGQQVGRAPCGLCHGTKMNGVPDDNDMVPGPALSRVKFLRVWEGRSLGVLYAYTHMTMPQSNPGFLPPEDYAAIIAYMLELSGAPAGETELPADVEALSLIRIVPQP